LNTKNNEWKIYYYDAKKFSAVQKPDDYKIPELNVVTDEVAMFINSLILPADTNPGRKII